MQSNYSNFISSNFNHKNVQFKTFNNLGSFNRSYIHGVLILPQQMLKISVAINRYTTNGTPSLYLSLIQSQNFKSYQGRTKHGIDY